MYRAMKCGQHADTNPGENRALDEQQLVSADRAMDFHFLLPVGSFQSPDLGRALGAIQNACVFGQIGERLRGRVTVQITSGSKQTEIVRRDSYRDQRRVL